MSMNPPGPSHRPLLWVLGLALMLAVVLALLTFIAEQAA